MFFLADLTKVEHSKMIYVVGYSRSGTTLLGRILGQGGEVLMFRELHFFEELYSPRSRRQSISEDEAGRLIATLFARQRNDYFLPGEIGLFLEEAYSLVEQLPRPITPSLLFASFLQYEVTRNEKTIPLEQTPRNVFYLEHILEQYPQAYAVNMVRDSRDTLLSQKLKCRRFWDDPNVPHIQCIRFWANYHPMTISILWNSSINAADRFKDHPRVLTIRFEDLVDEPERWVRNVCSFLDIKFVSQMLQISHLGSSHDQDNKSDLGVKKTVSQRWRRDLNNRLDLAVCQYLTHKNLTEHGYEISHRLRLKSLDAIWTLLTWPLKVSLALVFNLNRTRNLYQSIKRRLI